MTAVPKFDEDGRMFTPALIKKAKRTVHYLRVSGGDRGAAAVLEAVAERLHEAAYADAWAVEVDGVLYGPYVNREKAEAMAERLADKVHREQGIPPAWNVRPMTTQKARA